MWDVDVTMTFTFHLSSWLLGCLVFSSVFSSCPLYGPSVSLLLLGPSPIPSIGLPQHRPTHVPVAIRTWIQFFQVGGRPLEDWYKTAQNLVISAASPAAGVVTKQEAEEEISCDKAIYGACARWCGTVGVEPNWRGPRRMHTAFY